MDRGTITRNITFGTGALASRSLAVLLGVRQNARPVPYDPAQARRCSMPPAASRARRVRVKNGARLSLLLVYGQGSELARNATLAVQQDCAPLGSRSSSRAFRMPACTRPRRAAASSTAANSTSRLLLDLRRRSGRLVTVMCAMIPPAGNNVARYCSPEMDAASGRRSRRSTGPPESGLRTVESCSCATLRARSSTIGPGVRLYASAASLPAQRDQRGVERQDWTLSGGSRRRRILAANLTGRLENVRRPLDHHDRDREKSPRDRCLRRRHRAGDYGCHPADHHRRRRPARHRADRHRRARLPARLASGIEESSWESLRRTKVFLKAPITTPQGGGFKSSTSRCARRWHVRQRAPLLVAAPVRLDQASEHGHRHRARERGRRLRASSTGKPIKWRSASNSSRAPAASGSSATLSSMRAPTSEKKSRASPKTTS